LGAVKGADVEDYLSKLKEYEQQQQTADNGAPTMARNPCDGSVKSPMKPVAEVLSRLRTLSVRLPASVLPRRHLNIQP
jgi:hypothetical protein